MSEVWRNRIVGEREADPRELTAHPLNWRLHPPEQQKGMRAILDEVGIVQRVIVSQRTGRILDGHLRVEQAIAADQPRIPIVMVDVDEDEERIILATFDTLGGMAGVSRKAVVGLLGQIDATGKQPTLIG